MSDIWKLPSQPPPPMFLGEKERNYTKQINDELIERVTGQTVLYYPVDLRTTNFHQIYGEAIEKSFLPPIRVYALVKWDGDETSTDLSVMDKNAKITVNFHKKRLNEDQNLFVREGDFILYASRFYEIVKLNDPRLLFGQQEHKFEVTADCIKAREGLFQEPQQIIDAVQAINDIVCDDGPSVQQIVNVISSNGILVMSAADGSPDLPTIIDMANNPCNYVGRIIYITTLGSTIYNDFDQASKFYFNEGCEWFVSNFFLGP